jgi:hypothetical protein
METIVEENQKVQYISQIIEDQECNSYQEFKRKASDKETWMLLQTNY